MSRAAVRDCDEQRDGDLRRINQPGSCAYADRDSTSAVGIPSGSISEREELAQIAIRVQAAEEKILGPTFVGNGLLGSIEWKCHGRSLEGIHQAPTAARSG